MAWKLESESRLRNEHKVIVWNLDCNLLFGGPAGRVLQPTTG